MSLPVWRMLFNAWFVIVVRLIRVAQNETTRRRKIGLFVSMFDSSKDVGSQKLEDNLPQQVRVIMLLG